MAGLPRRATTGPFLARDAARSLRTSSCYEGLARLLCPLELRRARVDTPTQVHNIGIPRIGEVRRAVAAHALRECHFLGESRLSLRRGRHPSRQQLQARLGRRNYGGDIRSMPLDVGAPPFPPAWKVTCSAPSAAGSG